MELLSTEPSTPRNGYTPKLVLNGKYSPHLKQGSITATKINQDVEQMNEKTRNKVPTGKLQVCVYEFKKFNLAHSLMSVQLS
ncbi:unnamed protein product [Macrosiphum euphorbiae]|uniref:Uncharacterized protein n=1 Tax=Macrosiphum euphorbiae TaxID=13131 RepID=A0AAV0XIU3_9HEMI|nr:unnamed protein product [Macrosiphum euphorbiae]